MPILHAKMMPAIFLKCFTPADGRAVKPGCLMAVVLLLLLSACKEASVPSTSTDVWRPNAHAIFYLQLQANPDTPLVSNVAAGIYDIDLFDTSVEQIAQLKQLGHKVVCYFSAGSSEHWRADFKHFRPADMGKNMSGWQGERWLDTRSDNVRSLMLKRLDIAVSKGCDGVDADNVDGYSNDTGFKLTAQDQLDYNRFLSSQAHARSLAIGLKNDELQLAALANNFEFAVNEQCHEYDTCAAYRAFTAIGKPVLNIEYQQKYVSKKGGVYTTTPAFTKLCALARAAKFHTQVLPLKLDGSYRFVCN